MQDAHRIVNLCQHASGEVVPAKHQRFIYVTSHAAAASDAKFAFHHHTATLEHEHNSTLPFAHAMIDDQVATIEAADRRDLLDIRLRAKAVAAVAASGAIESRTSAEAAVCAVLADGSEFVEEACDMVTTFLAKRATEIVDVQAHSVPMPTVAELRTSLGFSAAASTVVDASSTVDARSRSAITAADARTSAAELRIADAKLGAADTTSGVSEISERNTATGECIPHARVHDSAREIDSLSSLAWEHRLLAEQHASMSAAANVAQRHAAAMAEATASNAQLETQLTAALATTNAVAEAAGSQICSLEVGDFDPQARVINL